MKPYNKLFLSSNNITGSFGNGKWHLLNAVKKHGSIQKAATELGRSYRKAWGDIKRAEEGFQQKIVTKVRGGKDGGSTILTDFGLELLKQWELYRRAVKKDVDKLYKKYIQKMCDS